MRVLRPLALLLIPLASQAATSPVQMTTQPKASVAASCVIKSLDTISLGAYSPITGQAVNGSGQLQLICTKGTTVSAVPTTGGSQLSGPGGSKLTYGLYLDASASQLWGGPATVRQDIDFYNSSSLWFSQRTQNVSLAACAALAQDTVFVYGGYQGCSYGYSPAQTSNGYSSAGTGNGLSYYNGGATQVITSPKSGYLFTIYLPSGSTKVSDSVYTVTTSRNGTTALTGTATTALAALTLPYYAKAAGGQDLAAGSYTDTVTVQVTF